MGIVAHADPRPLGGQPNTGRTSRGGGAHHPWSYLLETWRGGDLSEQELEGTE